jgi:hypothetical protein
MPFMPPMRFIIFIMPAALHLLHHALHLLEFIEQAVDFLHLHAGACGNAALACGLDEFGLAPLQRRHALDDAFLAAHVALGLVHVHLAGLGLPSAPASCPSGWTGRPSFHLLDLAEEVVEVKPAPLLTLAASFCAASMSTPAVTCSTSATMSPMPRMRPAWRSASNTSRPSIFSLVPANLIGAPVIWRTDSAAPPRESPSVLVRMMPVSGSLLEGLGGVDRVLALHGVDHEQRFHRVQGRVQVLDLAHQRFIDGQAAGGVDQQHVESNACARSRVRRARCPPVSGRACWGTTRRRPAPSPS